MSTFPDVVATDVTFSEDVIQVTLVDGRVVAVPLEWYPPLRDATEAERENWEFIGGGIGIHWPDLDEDLSVRGFLQPEAYIPSRQHG